jgi:hypothetical protein
MKTKFFYSLILAAGLIFAGSSVSYGQTTTTTKTVTKTTTTVKHAMKYTCPMHPEVVMDKAGKCPKCGMALVPKKDAKKEMMKGKMENMKDSAKMKHMHKMKESKPM